MKELIAVAKKYADLERDRIWADAMKKALQERESLAVKGLTSSSARLWTMTAICEDSIRDHGAATWQVLYDLLESSPRHYYRPREVDQIREFVRSRFAAPPDQENNFLCDESVSANQQNTPFHNKALLQLAETHTTTRERLDAEVDKYFCTRRSVVRWFMEFTQHPVISHGVIFALGLAASSLFKGCG